MDNLTQTPTVAIKKALFYFLLAPLVLGLSIACAKPALYGKIQRVAPVKRDYTATYEDLFKAAEWALSERGYSIEEKSLERGTLVTDWTPATPDSHYVEVFNRRDYGTVGAYHHLDLSIFKSPSQGDKIQVAVRSVSKSLVSRLRSTQREENKVLDLIQNALRGKEVEITNLGIETP